MQKKKKKEGGQICFYSCSFPTVTNQHGTRTIVVKKKFLEMLHVSYRPEFMGIECLDL
jgi:hypothetical protein